MSREPTASAAIASMPVLPAATVRLIEAMLASQEPSPELLLRSVALDKLLSARLLKIANSSFYRAAREARELKDVFARMGENEAASIALVLSLYESVFSGEMSPLFRHSLACAFTAACLADASERKDRSGLFTCGLLHDCGETVIERASLKQTDAAAVYFQCCGAIQPASSQDAEEHLPGTYTRTYQPTAVDIQ